MTMHKIVWTKLLVRGILTEALLDEMAPGEVFAQGEAEDSPRGINVLGSGKMLRWVAVRGEGIADWAVYAHYSTYTYDGVRRSGDKVYSAEYIKRLVPCTAGAFGRYR